MSINKDKKWQTTDQILPVKSISDQIYDILKKKILYNEIKPGERLMQEEISEVLKASRTPIRHAFALLEKDGLIERLPQGGMRVTHIDIETVKDVFGIRSVLEAYAVELTCEKIQESDIIQMIKIEKEASAILASFSVDAETSLAKLLELNSSFHQIIYRCTGSTLLPTLINNLKSIGLRIRAFSMRDAKTWSQAWKEHAQLIECFERKDKMSASTIMRDHISAGASYCLRLLT